MRYYNMYKSLLCAVALWLCAFVDVLAQYSVTSYSVSDGLSQNSVDQVFQDSRGRLWFATWDGLNLFDGYAFHNYKGNPKKGVMLSNNRVTKVTEDAYGYLWTVCNNGEAQRFDPSTGSFELVQESRNLPVYRIEVLSNGYVWLLADRQNGAIRLVVDSLAQTFKADLNLSGSQSQGYGRIEQIHEDSNGNQWLPTLDNGLFYVKAGTAEVNDNYSYARSGVSKSVFSLCETSGNMFFGSEDGRVWQYDKRKKRMSLLKLDAQSPVICILQLPDNRLMFATKEDGIFISSTDQRQFKPYNTHTASWIISDRIQWMEKEETGAVWIQTTGTADLLRYDPLTDKATRFIASGPLPGNGNRDRLNVIDAGQETVWLYPFNGVAHYDKRTNRLENLNLNHPQLWNAKKVHFSIFLDRQGALWVSSMRWLGKVVMPKSDFHTRTLPSGGKNPEVDQALRSILFADSLLWVGTRGGALQTYDLDYKLQATYPIGAPYCMMKDRKGRYWVGTKGRGVFVGKRVGGPTQYQFTQYKYSRDDLYSLSVNDVYDIHEDGEGHVWVATMGGGLNLVDERDGTLRFINYRNEWVDYPMKSSAKVRALSSDNKGNLWVGTDEGILTFPCTFRSVADFRPTLIQNDPQDGHSLPSNNIYSIYFSRSGEGYLGTYGSGLVRICGVDNGKYRFRNYTMRDGMESDIVYAIHEDRQGDLWMVGETGLTQYRIKENQFDSFDSYAIGFPVMFSEGKFVQLPSGWLAMPTYAGLFTFDPDKVKKRDYVPPIVIAGFHLDEDSSYVSGEGIPTEPDYMDNLKLKPNQRTFTIDYAAVETCNPLGVHYAYILEGFDDDWHYVGRQRTASYINLPKGTYRFKVRSTNGEGVWVDNTRTIRLELLPSFWETSWVIVLYVLGALMLFAVAIYLYAKFYNLRSRVHFEKELAEAKLKVFTDVSHELRTPLTLITAPVENLLQQDDLSDMVRGQLELIHRNVDRMLRLVNQILDFRKLQCNKMRMRVERIEMVSFVSKIKHDFDEVANDHHIYYVFSHTSDSLYLWADADKLEKILFNLLSNAFKYTPDGKMIEISLRDDSDYVYLSVRDEGVGVSEDRMKHLFQYFANWSDKSVTGQPSTGIGLSVVKQLAELHKAEVSVTSKEGSGSCFEVKFRQGREHYDDNVEWIMNDETEQQPTLNTREDELGKTEKGRDSILIIEDNDEMRTFLCGIFNTLYNVYEAEDGEVGVRKAKEVYPSLIICDMMMPRKDGLAVVSELRGDINTSHIPIIVLTAKTNFDSRLQSMNEGADDYITKPFSSVYLKARVCNLLAQRERMKAFYCQHIMDVEESGAGTQEEAPKKYVSENDRKFMDGLTAVMEKHLNDFEFNVDDLASEMLMSRSTFFRKLNSLIGMSPVEFILQTRMKRAAQLIAENQHSISEISLMVGISNAQYFSRCFKKVYQMTPTEYREKSTAQHASGHKTSEQGVRREE